MHSSTITKFITRQRLHIIVSSVLITVVLLICAAMLKIESLAGSLMINLAASSLTVGATITLVDYLLFKEKNIESREGRIMAQLEAKSIQMQLGTAVNNLYRRYTPKQSSSTPNANEDDYIKYVYSHLDEVDFQDESFKFHAKDIKLFESEISTTINSVEKIISMYGYALTAVNRTNLHNLYTSLRATESILSSRRHMMLAVKEDDSTKSRELTKRFDSLLMLVSKQLYRSSENKFTVDV
jgi:hypothetical protein